MGCLFLLFFCLLDVGRQLVDLKWMTGFWLEDPATEGVNTSSFTKPFVFSFGVGLE